LMDGFILLKHINFLSSKCKKTDSFLVHEGREHTS
jgi:hypothetical protein